MKCENCWWYRPHADGLGTCFVFSTPFGGDSTPVCGSFTPQNPKERDTKTTAGMFAEALGCIADASYWLHQVGLQFPEDDDEQWDNVFWGEVEEAEQALDRILGDLNAIEKDILKEVTA